MGGMRNAWPWASTDGLDAASPGALATGPGFRPRFWLGQLGSQSMSRIGVIGAGRWGRALAHVASAAGHDVQVVEQAAPDAAALAAGRCADPCRSGAGGARRCCSPCSVAARRAAHHRRQGHRTGHREFMHEVVADCAPEPPCPWFCRARVLRRMCWRACPPPWYWPRLNLADGHAWASALSIAAFRIYALG